MSSRSAGLASGEIESMWTVLTYMNGNDRLYLVEDFKRFSQTIDRARGEHVARTFPELTGWWSRICGNQ